MDSICDIACPAFLQRNKPLVSVFSGLPINFRGGENGEVQVQLKFNRHSSSRGTSVRSEEGALFS